MAFEEFKEKVKEAADIVEIASQYTNLKRAGRYYRGLCPFHSEKTPSFYVDPEKKLYHCFGCGAGGDVIKLVMEMERLSFAEALKKLAERYNIPIPESKGTRKFEDILYEVMERAHRAYVEELWKGENKARAYLKERGVSEETARELGLGYAPASWNFILEKLADKYRPELLEQAGLVINKEGRYYDRFRDRLIFPIYTEFNRVVGFGGRTLAGDDAKYINSPETNIYKKGRVLYGLNWSKGWIREKGVAVVVEGYMDFLSLYANGVKNAVACLGTSLTSDQASLLSRFAKKVVLSFDNDEAGRTAAARSIPILWEKDMEVKVVSLEDAKDPDEFIAKYGSASYINKIEEAKSGVAFIYEYYFQKEKKGAVKVVLENISSFRDEIKKRYAVSELAQLAMVEEGILLAMLRSGGKEEAAVVAAQLSPAEEFLIKAMFFSPEPVLQVLARKDLSFLAENPNLSYLQHLLRRFSERGKLEVEDLDLIETDRKHRIYSLLFESGEEHFSVSQVDNFFRELEMMSVKEKIKRLQLQIKRAEASGDMEMVRKLVREKDKLTRKLSEERRRKNGNQKEIS